MVTVYANISESEEGKSMTGQHLEIGQLNMHTFEYIGTGKICMFGASS